MATVDLLLHPIRLRILRAMLDGRPSTTGQLRDRLPDVPPTTLYRHVAVLADAGVLEVLDERRVRGAVERTYQVRWDHAELDADARAAMTPGDHQRAFTAFVAGILGDFDRYLTGRPADPTADGVSYRQAALWLSDKEMSDLLAELHAVIKARTHHAPSSGRTRRMVSLLTMPAGS